MHTLPTLAVLLLAAARSASAVGCATHTYGSCADGIVHWYDPDDGQICDPLDCGGGRAPPKTTDPCCTAAYTGTAACADAPSYMPCFTAAGASASSTTTTTATAAAATTTTTTAAAGTETASEKGSSASSAAVLTTVTPTGSEGGAVTSAPTTSTVMAGGSGNSTTTTSGSSSAAVATNAAGYAQRHPFMAIAGAAVGVVLL